MLRQWRNNIGGKFKRIPSSDKSIEKRKKIYLNRIVTLSDFRARPLELGDRVAAAKLVHLRNLLLYAAPIFQRYVS